MENPEASAEELSQFVPAPDFPTGGIMLGNAGALEAYAHGRGTVTVRGRAEIDLDDKGRARIIISELPYQVNKAALVERIAILASQKKLEHVRDVRDETNKQGMRVVVELGAQAQPQVVLNNLYKHTQLQTNYSMIMLALRDGAPRLLNLRELLQVFVDHRRVVVRRRTEFDKRKAEERAHILEGLKIALDNLDAVVKLIRESRDPEVAKKGLIEKFALTEIQAKAILDMRLSQLTSLESQKIIDELAELYAKIKEFEAILADPLKLDGVVLKELKAVTAKYGDERRTMIATVSDDGSFLDEELIRKEDVVVTLSRGGYMKRTPASVYEAQHRGGRGKIGAKTAAEDVVHHVIHTNTHDTLLCFTTRGAVHSMRVYKIPAYDRAAKGLPVVNMLNLQAGEAITALIPLADFSHPTLFFCTAQGTVKRCALSEFASLRVTGKRALTLDEGDSLAFVVPTTGSDQVLITTRYGMAVKFEEEQVRVMGTGAAGVRGVRLQGDDDRVVGMDVAGDEESLLVVGERGYGKRSKVELFRKTNRGAKGVIAMKATEKTGPVIAAVKVMDSDELLILTREGMIIRMETDKISQLGRATQGVRLINLREGDSVASVEPIRMAGEPELFTE
jgi:DNA gyrase subunit A